MALKYGSTTISPSHTVKYGSTALKSLKYGTTEVWKKEEIIVSGLSVTTDIASGQNTLRQQYSDEYSVSSGFSTVVITGTAKGQVVGQGTYGYSAQVVVQGYYSSAWHDLKAYGVGANSDKTVTANDSVSLSGSSKLRVWCWIRTADIGGGQATSGKASCSNFQLLVK